MWIAFIAAAVCFAVAVVLFTPLFRSVAVFRPVALFFIFEGLWILGNYLVTQIWPGLNVMQWVHYIGIVVFGGYLLLCLFYSRPKKEGAEKQIKQRRRRRKDRQRSHRSDSSE